MDEKYALTVLTRLAARCPEEMPRIRQILEERLDRLGKVAIEVALETEGPIGAALAGAVERSASPDLARMLTGSIPDVTVSLLDAAVALERRASEVFVREGGSGVANDRAKHMVRLSQHLAAQGKLKEALMMATDAVAQARRVLSGEQLLATCLGEMSGLLMKIGSAQAAIDASTESVELWQRLYEKDPALHWRSRADGLLTYSDELAAIGNFPDSLAAAKEALQLSEAVDKKSNIEAQYTHAYALYTVAARLSHDSAEALTYGQQCVEIQRDLYEQNADRFRASFARSLNLLGALMLAAGQNADAHRALDEAEPLLRRLVAEQPGGFEDTLTRVLLNKLQLLRELGELIEAFRVADEIGAILRRLTAENPMRYAPRLSDLYAIIASLHETALQPERALDAYHKGIVLISTAFMNLPSSALEQMDRLVTSYWKCSQELGQSEVPRLVHFFVDLLHRIIVEERLDPHRNKHATFKFDSTVLQLLFDEKAAASERYPEEPAIRQAAASAGLNALDFALEQNDSVAAASLLETLAHINARHPSDTYIAEEYSTALRNFTKISGERGAATQALSAWQRLEHLAAERPLLPQLREDLAQATFPLMRQVPLDDARRLFAHLQTLAETFPVEPALRLCAVKAAVNVLQTEAEDEDLVRTSYAWSRAQVDRYPSAPLRGLLGLIAFNYLTWLLHRERVEQADQVYQGLRDLAERFSDEEDTLDAAAMAHEALVRAYVVLERIDDAQACFDQYCRHMQLARKCRLSRTQALQTLTLGYQLAKCNRPAARCIKLLLRSVANENGDEEFVEIARQLKRTLKFTAPIPGDTEPEA
jgi:hypothetical protein